MSITGIIIIISITLFCIIIGINLVYAIKGKGLPKTTFRKIIIIPWYILGFIIMAIVVIYLKVFRGLKNSDFS